MIHTVIKRDGTKEPFDPEKLNRWGQYAAKTGGDWSTVVMNTVKRLPSIVSSEDIHQTMIDVCIELEAIEYSRLAARLQFATLRKNLSGLGVSDKGSFKDIYEALCVHGVWNKDSLPEYDPVWEDWYSQLYELRLEYWQVKQFDDKYGLKHKGKVVETPHVAMLALALAHHGTTQLAFDTALAILQGKLNLPTPALNGGRNGDFDSVSCCVITGGDTVDSIGVAEHIAYKMTAKKAGIGIEFQTRSKGAPVKGGRVAHLGKHGIYATVDKAVKMFSQITRGGSATVTYTAIDPQIMEMLLWKTQKIDIEQRIDKLDYSMAYNDAFIEAVINDADWYLFDYLLVPEMHEAFYTSSAEDYKSLVEKYKHLSSGNVKAQDLLKRFLTSRQETGRIYCLNVTRANTHTPFLDKVYLSNLCVAPETKILTRDGYLPISELEGEKLDIWNGEEFSEVTVCKTGENQKLLTVNTTSGYSLDCTPYHKFYVFNGYGRKPIMKRAHELCSGDKLIKFDLPVIEGSKHLDKAYINGFFSGDGCSYNGKNLVYLYGEKKKLSHIFKEAPHTYFIDQQAQDRQVFHMSDLKEKFFVPCSEYTVESRLEWLSGFLDADGCIYRNGINEAITASSIDTVFLGELQLMLQTLGVSSEVIKNAEAGFRKLPANDGTGDLKDYWCKDSYRLLISSYDSYRLLELGLKFNRLKISNRRPQRDAKQFVQVESVIDTGRVDDTYCFTEHKRGMGMFNGILTGNCQEIMLPTKPYLGMDDLYSKEHSVGETAFCSLAAINVGKVDTDLKEYPRIAEVALRTVDSMISKTSAMTRSMYNSMQSRRSVGIGITGLAQYLYKLGTDYTGDDYSLSAVSKLAEMHYHSLLSASQEMVRDGTCKPVSGINLDWLPIDTSLNKYRPELDWERLRGVDRGHSVLVAHMPTESSAVFSGATNGLYPPRDKIIYKQSRKGTVQFILDNDNFIPFWDVSNITMSKYYSRVQDFTDQGISADYTVVPERFPNGKVPLSQLMKEWLAQAKLGNKTMYYTNTKPNKTVSVQDLISSREVEEDACQGGCKI